MIITKDSRGFDVVDFESKAKTDCSCDHCQAKLGEHGYPSHRDAISISLKAGKDEQGYDKSASHHFCNESCLRGFLNKRAEAEDAAAKPKTEACSC